MTNGIDDKEIPFEELKDERFLCKYDKERQFIWGRHEKFFLTRNVKTGIVFANCTQCGAAYQIQDGKLP